MEVSQQRLSLRSLQKKDIDWENPEKLCDHTGMVGQLTLDQHIGVRIPGGQPKFEF